MTETNRASLFQAIKKGDRQAVEDLLASGAELASARDESGVSAVLTAIYYGQPAIADLLIAGRERLNASLDLFEASAAGRADRVEDLLRAAPDRVNDFAPDGFQALGLAAFFGHPQVARVLLEHGADPNTPSHNKMRVPPLNSAAAGGHLEVARLLLDYGANPNALQGEGFAPLHSAAQNGQAELVELLLRRGAGPQVRTSGGKTPWDLAQEAGHLELKPLLALS